MKHEIIHTIFERGGENTAFAQYFVGQSYLNMLSTQGVAIGNVTFAPGCRNNWHIHHASKGGGTDPAVHWRPGVVPRGRAARPRAACRGRGPYPSRRQTLAWGGSGQLVHPSGSGGPRGRHPQ